MRTRKFPALLALLIAFAAITAGSASAHHDADLSGADTGDGDGPKTAELTAVVTDAALEGTRVITTVSGSDPTGTLVDGQIALVTAGSNTVLEGALEVAVTETVVPGVADWHVTTQSSALTYTDANSVTHEIDLANLFVADRTVNDDLLDASVSSSTPATAKEDLTTERELFTVTGQDPGTLYTALYTSASTVSLELPDSFTEGTYGSTITVTLYD